jgi:hypothetical protein
MPVVKRIAAVYTDFNNKLTAARAGNLDNLPFLVAPAALATDVGGVNDTPGMTSSLFAAQQQIFNQLVTLDKQLAILASAEQVRTLILPGYSSTVLLSAGNTPTNLQGNVQVVSWPGGSVGAYLHSARHYGLTLPQQALIPLYGTIAGTDASVGTIVSSSSQGTLALTLNTTNPTTAGVGQALVAFGNPTSTNWWGIVGQAGGAVALACPGTTVPFALSAFPITVHWSAAGVTVFDKSGVAVATIATAHLPAAATSQTYNLYVTSGLNYVVAVEYI